MHIFPIKYMQIVNRPEYLFVYWSPASCRTILHWEQLHCMAKVTLRLTNDHNLPKISTTRNSSTRHNQATRLAPTDNLDWPGLSMQMQNLSPPLHPTTGLLSLTGATVLHILSLNIDVPTLDIYIHTYIM